MWQHRVEVHLALSAVNLQDSSLTRFVIAYYNNYDGTITSLPYMVLPLGSTCIATAKQLFTELTGCDVDSWFVMRQVGVIDDISKAGDDIVIVLYAVFMQDVVPLLDSRAKWVSFDVLKESPGLLSMFGKASNYNKDYL